MRRIAAHDRRRMEDDWIILLQIEGSRVDTFTTTMLLGFLTDFYQALKSTPKSVEIK